MYMLGKMLGQGWMTNFALISEQVPNHTAFLNGICCMMLGLGACLVGRQNVGMHDHEHANCFYQNLGKFIITFG